ncbi:MAG: hypothetical protein Q7R46_02215 [bacterium]|nr:hypothetical protein [bacterium]
MIFSITEIVWAATTLLVFICAIRIYRLYRKTKDETLKNYNKFFIFSGFGFLGLTLADPIIADKFFMKLSVVAGLFFMYLGLSYLAKIAAQFAYPKFASKVFWTVIAGDVAAVLVNIKYYLFSPGRSPFLDPKTGAFIVDIPMLAAILIVVLSVAALIVPGVVFVRMANRSADQEVKTKGTLVSWGLIFFGFGGLMCGFANILSSRVSPAVMSASNLFIALAIMLLFAGVFYVVERRAPKTISVKTITAASSRIQW